MIQKSIAFLILSQTLLFGQNPIDYAVHIQPIITQNCVPCHKKGGIGPFSLEQYEDVAKRADFIAEVTQSRYMPPFPADKSFQHYANERGLKNEEIELIQKWVKSPPAPRGGSPKSKEKKLPFWGLGGLLFPSKCSGLLLFQTPMRKSLGIFMCRQT